MDSNKYYTDERNVQIVISLLKAHGIRKVIASPGTTNMTFVGSIQNDPFFEIYSVVDERSAAYMACGMAAESGEPVVLSCTGATASRNYMSGLTEAYYRKLPVLAITSHRGDFHIGHLKDQQIDRRSRPADIAVESVTIPLVKDEGDARFCEIEGNKAILALRQNGGGPVHINMFTAYSRNFTVKTLPEIRVIRRYNINDPLPELPSGRTAIFIGSHRRFTDEETALIDKFCAVHDAVVFCDHTSGYDGAYKIIWGLVACQRQYKSELSKIDTLIHLGEIPGSVYIGLAPKKVWRVSEDGALRDLFGKLTDVFQMSELLFFKAYSDGEGGKMRYLQACKEEYQKIYELVPDLPFGNIWIAKNISDKLPSCELHFGILNSLRSWSFFNISQGIYGNCNVGGYGIDGGISSMIGASLASSEKLFIGIFGDLAFFYDMNSLGNRHVGKNMRIMLINNGRGTEFRNYGHPCYPYGESADEFMAAAGHFGNKSLQLVRHYAEDLGYKYITASNKEEFNAVYKDFLSPELKQSMIFEVFTDTKDESDALEKICNLREMPKNGIEKLKGTVKDIVGSKGIKAMKKLLGKE